MVSWRHCDSGGWMKRGEWHCPALSLFILHGPHLCGLRYGAANQLWKLQSQNLYQFFHLVCKSLPSIYSIRPKESSSNHNRRNSAQNLISLMGESCPRGDAWVLPCRRPRCSTRCRYSNKQGAELHVIGDPGVCRNAVWTAWEGQGCFLLQEGCELDLEVPLGISFTTSHAEQSVCWITEEKKGRALKTDMWVGTGVWKWVGATWAPFEVSDID